MALQQTISRQNLEKKLDKIYEVLIEDKTFDGTYYVGRTKQDVPEMDGMVYIKAEGMPSDKVINHFVTCKITGVSAYDLIGKFC